MSLTTKLKLRVLIPLILVIVLTISGLTIITSLENDKLLVPAQKDIKKIKLRKN